MSLMAAVGGIGMLLAVALFLFGGPVFGIGVFLLVWVLALFSIIGYHLWNAISPHGVDHTQFHFEGEHSDERMP
jgi:hypothetical protein